MSLPVTEDTPPDMLAGSMDLNVVLPNGKNVKMSIQRSTPMMDLLVQATTAHRLSPGNYSIQAMGDRGVLPYKPSTPIGTLDAFKIKIVDKKLNSHKKAPQLPQAFLNTFRLQVNLPRSQLFVARVIPDITLSEVLKHVCTEKNLDINKYEFRNPAKPDEVLDLEKTLGYYKIQELSLVNKNKRICGGLSAADILHVKSSMLRQNSVCDSSLSSGSLGSRSTSPVPVNLPRVPPQPPVRKKRRPAPKPPQITENESKEETKTSRSGLISHSRESSDSSGYHEASVLSESPTHGGPLARSESSSPPDTLPRHGKLLPSQSFTNLSTIQPAPRTRLASSVSNASLNSNGASRKKRAAPPPPTATYHAPEEKMKSSTLPTSRAEERIISNVPFVSVENGDIPAVEDAKVETVENSVEINTKVDSEIVVKPVPKPRTMPSENSKEREKKVSIIRSQTKSAILTDETSTEPPPENKSSSSENLKIVKSVPKMATDEDCKFASNSSCLERWQKVDSLACLNEDEAKATKTAWLLGDSEPENITPSDEHDSLNWQYQLPPPPTDFRDSHSPICTELGTVTIMPDMYKEEVTYAKEPEGTKIKDCLPREEEEEEEVEVRTPQKKMAVMNELTNVLSSDGWKAKKSSSVTNLHASDETNNRKTSGLSYSRSFTNDFPKALKLPAYETYGAENNRDDNYEKEIRYKNNRNLEKSLSMECIQSRTVDDHGRAEECFRRPVAPVQKKLKVAKRSASTMGYNPAQQRKSDSDLNCNGDSDNIDDLLRQHFLDFLKERKLTNDLNMKSLDVIRHILPQINGEKLEAKDPVPKATVKGTDLIKKSSVLLEREVKENIVVIENDEYVKEAEVRTKEPEVKKADPVKRLSYHAPPSINFATWGERPKTQVLIKDEDYVTEVAMKIEKKPAEAPKPVIQKKPSTLQFKKPGVKSHYEMFSALPKKKEVTPLTLIQMEEEEKKKRKAEEEEERKKRAEEERKKRADEAREPSRVPVVCAVELKKEFREQQQKGVVSEVTIRPEPVPPHSVSIYVNGSQRNAETAKAVVSETKPFVSTFPIQKRNPIMPVVKGFRTAEDQHFQSHVNINKVCKFNSHIGNQTAIESKESVPKSQNSKHVTEVCLPPPPPPPPIFGPVNLRPVSARKIQPKTESADPRGQLMAEIRNFRGFNLQKLKTAQ